MQLEFSVRSREYYLRPAPDELYLDVAESSPVLQPQCRLCRESMVVTKQNPCKSVVKAEFDGLKLVHATRCTATVHFRPDVVTRCQFTLRPLHLHRQLPHLGQSGISFVLTDDAKTCRDGCELAASVL